MFFGFLRRDLPKDILTGYVDIHSHLLPGVDDGFQDKEKSLQALRFFEQKGVEAIVLTPHFMNEYPDNKRDSITAIYENFAAEAEKQGGIKLFIGGEYMLDSGFADRNKEGFLTLGKSKTVLCETSYMMCEPLAGQMLYNAALDGYDLVIAHPERYVYANRKDYERWKSLGYKFQLNLLSFSGANGRMANDKALSLIDNDMYDYIGTDIHNLDHFIHHIKHIRLNGKQIDKILGLMANNKSLVL